MVYVLDSSFIAASITPDEINEKIKNIYNSFKIDDQRYTPQLFWYEIANIFMNMIRRKRYVYEQFSHFNILLDGIRLTTDYETGLNYSQKLLQLCNKYNLSSYDAAYLELAERKNAVLCTLDKGLIDAAKKHGVSLINGV